MLKIMTYIMWSYIFYKYFTKKVEFQEIYINYSEITEKDLKKIVKDLF